MHVPKLKKKKWLIVAAGAVIIIGGIVYKVSTANKNTAVDAGPMYQTMALEKQDLTKKIGLSGVLDSAHSESVSSTLEGVKVKEVCVQVGDMVQAGDVLFRFDSTEVQQKLDQALKTQTSDQEKTAADVKASERNFTDAQTTQNVEAGRTAESVTDSTNDYNNAMATKSGADALYQSAVSDREAKEKTLKSAKEEAKTAKEEANTAKSALETAKKGSDEAAIKKAQSAYDNAAAKQTKAEAAKTNAQKALDTSKQNESDMKALAQSAAEGVNTAADALKSAQRAKEDSDRSNQKNVADQKDSLDSVKKSAAEGSESSQTVKDLQTQLANCEVKAGTSGVVTFIGVKVGDAYTSGAMATIQDEKNYVVTAMVDQYDISDVSKGMPAVIKTETTGDTEMTGTIDFVSPVPGSASTDGSSSGGTATGNYEIHIPVDNPSERLRIGMNAKVELIQEQVKNIYAVQSDCIQQKEDGSSYIQVLENNEPREITVVPGLVTDYYTEITAKDLTDGMEVIIPDVTAEDTSADGVVTIY